ncbi:MAG: histidine--tRNA ligase [Alphaproteobacteria bacterium]
MSALQPVRGTRDLLPDDSRRHRHVVETARAIAERYGYLEIAVPILEPTEVFKRTLGDTSDVVTKEMYTFTDRGGEMVTMRPEATAGIARALITGGLTQDLPFKVFTHGPMFRYERPQKGRLRQFHQIDVELLGVAEPLGDIEVIALGARVLDAFGVRRATVLELNTLGDAESRTAYRGALVGYLEGFRDKLSEDSRARLGRNPLRILDSKNEGDRAIVANAPIFTDYLNEASKNFFATVCGGLDALGIAYQVNPRLVRGLDYYCHTAFEFTTTELGSQGAVLAGGRYDGLVETMGGPSVPGIGWAAGIERLAMLMAALGSDAPAPARPIAIVPIGAAAEAKALVLADELRAAGFAIELGYRGNVGKRMKRANKLNAGIAVLLGDDELARGAATVRNLDSGEQTEVPLAALRDHLGR